MKGCLSFAVYVIVALIIFVFMDGDSQTTTFEVFSFLYVVALSIVIENLDEEKH